MGGFAVVFDVMQPLQKAYGFSFTPTTCHATLLTAWWRRSEEQPLVHAWVGLRGADKQVVVYNCPVLLHVEGFLLFFLLRSLQKPFILLRGCSGR